jgi:hypothetical protein
MDRTSVKTALRALWPILYAAEQRPLEVAEFREIYRLLSSLDRSIVSAPGFREQLGEFTQSIRSCGLFDEPPKAPQGLAAMRGRIDELCSLL